MSERYQRLFELDKNLYVVGCPVVISAGAITKDNETGRVFIQLKIKNISDKTIKAVIASFSGYDVQKNNIGEKIVYEYLDLNCNFNEEIGAKIPVFLNNAGTRSFSADNIKVIFSDDNSCEMDFSQAVSIPELEELSAEYDEDQLNQFKMQFGSNCKFLPQKYEDLFFCSCGAVNRSEKCGLCGYSISEMLAIDPEVLKNDGIYNKALDEVSKGKKENYENAIESFESIIDWKDSRAKIDECTAKIKDIDIAEEKAEAERKRKEEEARITTEKARARNKKIAIIGGPIVAALIVFLIVLNMVILPKQNLNKAMAQLDAGNYDEAYSLLDRLGESDIINGSKYDRAIELINKKDYDSALILLKQIKGYKDSNDKLENCYIGKYGEEKWYAFKALKVGDSYTFGAYEQDNDTTNGKEEIEWRVLAKEEGRILVISEYALDCQKYNTPYTDVTWETCSLRKWLNETFFKSAFSAEEQKMIPETRVTAYANTIYSTDPGDDTTDKVFLLSITEAKKYFSNNEDRKCVPTAYAIEQGAYTSSRYTKGGKATCWWWLRSPGGDTRHAALVRNYDGYISDYGHYVDHSDACVRPALWIDILHN